MSRTPINDDEIKLTRRHALECMVWAGTGVLWTMSGGVPVARGLLGEAKAATDTGFSFLQMSDSHIGFNKAANPDALATLREAVAKVKAMTVKPSYILHTGDITHLSKASEFDNADQVFGTTSSMKRAARPISTATARVARARAGTASTTMACISSGW